MMPVLFLLQRLISSKREAFQVYQIGPDGKPWVVCSTDHLPQQYVGAGQLLPIYLDDKSLRSNLVAGQAIAELTTGTNCPTDEEQQ